MTSVRNRAWISAVLLAAMACANQHWRSPREMSLTATDVLTGSDFRTTGQKWSSDEYHTLSSLTSNEPGVRSPPPPQSTGMPAAVPVLDDPVAQDAEKDEHAYPALTTDPSLPFVITRDVTGGYVRNPYTYGASLGYHAQDPDTDRRPEYSTNNVVPKWNR